jgi:prepilin-type N-terminal cleavage/methylation domain-containing protein
MRLAIRSSRSAFSLLEMMIALAIGMLLLAALYAFMSAQVTMTQAGRDLVEEGALVRSIFNRISNDIITQVGPYDPRMVNAPQPATTATLSGSTGSAAPSGNMATTTTPATSTSNSAAAATPPPAPVVTYNIGVYGTATMLQISNYRVQTAPPGILTGTVDPNLEVISDLRRVTYWLSQDGNGTAGLSRYEFRQGTADAINQDPTTLPDQQKSIIAKEVLSITFEYWDGTQWNQQWDGTELCSDEVTPAGPPVAIRITMTLRRNANRGKGPVDPAADQGPTFQHVVAMPSANFFNQANGQITGQ